MNDLKFFKWNKHYLGWGITAFVVIVASILVGTMLNNFSSITTALGNFLSAISPIIYGLVIAYLLTPVVTFFEKRVLRLFFTKSDQPFAEIAKHNTNGASEKDDTAEKGEKGQMVSKMSNY